MNHESIKFALFDRFEIAMTLDEARSASHQGQCDDDVEALLAVESMLRQLDKIPPHKIRDELRGYGAWDEAELADDEQNRRRIVWIAAGNIVEESNTTDR